MAEEKPYFLSDLIELRSRLIKSVVFYFLTVFLFYIFLLNATFQEILKYVPKVVYTAPYDLFVAEVSLSFWGGLVLSWPFLLYQIGKFIHPALLSVEKRAIWRILPLSLILLIMGVLFGHFVMVPMALNFFLGIHQMHVEPMITLQNYFSFWISIVTAFAFVFQFPLIVIFLIKTRLVSVKQFSKWRRFIYVLIFIISAVLTPPDVISQLLMAVPLLILFELSMLFGRAITKKNSDLSSLK